MAPLPNHKKLRKKLFVFHTEFIHTRGGEKYLYEILKRIATTYETTLYVHKINTYWRSRFMRHGVKVQLFWTPRRLYWPLLPLTLLINIFSLRKEIPADSYVFATNFPVNTLALYVSKHIICHCFEPLGVFYDQRRIRSLSWFSRSSITIAKWLYSWLDKLTVRKSAVLTTLNTSVVPHIVSVYSRKPDMYIANGIDVKFFTPPKARSKKKYFVVGHSTDYTVFKGTAEFLAGLGRLENKSQYKVLISETRNDPAVRAEYERSIHDLGLTKMVQFVGNVSEQGLKKMYQSLDVFCYTGSPHSAGGSTASLSVLEAQACGASVVRSIGNKDEIVSGRTGIYIDPDNPAAIARAITALASDYKRCQAMGKAARKHVVARHSWDKSVTQLRNALSHIQRKNYENT